LSEETRGGPGEFAAGSQVAGYRLEEQIGQGGMAVVFRAYDSRLDRYVALKIMAPGLALDDAFRQRFIRESRAAAAVDDAHIIPVFEAGEESGVLFIAMRFVRGGDVRSLLDRTGPLSPRRATEIISQVASALDSAHARGLVHRDVKPANMLLDESTDSDRPDHVYLSDFGLTKESLAAPGLTSTGQFLGTLDYVAPEQIEGRPVDGRTDLYALACATFELLTGAPPFRRDQGMAVMYAQVSEPPPRLSSRRQGLPASVDDIMNRALAKSPADRYASCQEFAAALRRAFGLAGDSGPRAPGPGRPPTQIATSLPRPETGRAAGTAAARGAASPPEEYGATSAPGMGGAAAAGGDPGREQPRHEQPEPSAGGPPTQAAGYPVPRPTKPGLTEPPGGPGGYGGSGGGPGGDGSWPGQSRRPWWRSPLPIAAIFAVVVILGGGGFLLLGGSGGNNSDGGKSGGGTGATGTIQSCTAATPQLKPLTKVTSQKTAAGGSTPFAVQESKDGRYTFVTVNTGLAVLQNEAGLAPKLLHVIHIAGNNKGMAFTSDGRYLLIANGQGAAIVDVAAAELNQADAVRGVLRSPKTSPHDNGAVGVRVSRDNQYAFVTMQNTTSMAVFRLGKFIAAGFTGRSFAGLVPLGTQPVGIGQSADGKWLYATSFRKTPGAGPGQGTLSVINMKAAETQPATSVKATVDAGCSPARVLTSADGKTVWVTARDSNAVLGFSASKLLTDSSHALVANVRVGSGPIGLSLAAGGSRIVVADSNYVDTTGKAGDLAVIDPAKALAGKPALLGVIPAGGQPRQLAQADHGHRLLVTDQLTGQLQDITVATLP
jgi:DNA-binding beta-propeller fold protein YncE